MKKIVFLQCCHASFAKGLDKLVMIRMVVLEWLIQKNKNNL